MIFIITYDIIIILLSVAVAASHNIIIKINIIVINKIIET